MSLDGVLGVSVSYETREDQDSGSPEVDLARGMDHNFSLFLRKQQFRRMLVEKISKFR